MYASIFGIKCLIQNSTEIGEAVENCVAGRKNFDGWNFYLRCTQCMEGYHLNEKKNICMVVNNLNSDPAPE
jgi:hypothetical protein